MNARLQWLLEQLTHPQAPAIRVLISGAAGGILAVMAALLFGELKLPWYAALLPHMVLGAGAAFVAVFVLTGTNTTDIYRCCGVALIAGFFWRPVFDAGKEYLLTQPDRVAAAETAKLTGELETTYQHLVRSPSDPGLIAQAGRLAETLTREAADLPRSSTRTRAQFALTRTLDLLGDHAEKGQPAAASEVLKVAEVAVRTGNQAVLDTARQQLPRIAPGTNASIENRRKELMLRLPPR